MNNSISLLLVIFFINSSTALCETLKAVREKTDPSTGSNDITFNHDFTKFLISGFKKATIYDAASNTIERSFSADENVISAKFNFDGTKIVTVSENIAKIWNAQNGKSIQILKHPGKVFSASFSPDGNKIVTTSVLDPEEKWTSEHVIKVWDTNGHELKSITGGYGFRPRTAIFSKDGTQLIVATASYNRIYNPETGAIIFEFGKDSDGHRNTVNSVNLNNDGDKIVTASVDKTAIIWDLSTRSLLHKLKTSGVMVLSASFSHDGSMVATANFENAQIWDTQSGALLATITGNINRINSAVFNKDGTKVYLVGIGNLGKDIKDILEIWQLLPK